MKWTTLTKTLYQRL